MPCAHKASMARSTAWPFAMPPRSIQSARRRRTPSSSSISMSFQFAPSTSAASSLGAGSIPHATNCAATVTSKAPSVCSLSINASRSTSPVCASTVTRCPGAAACIRERSLSASWKLMRAWTWVIAANAASIARWAPASSASSTRMLTVVPSSGRARSILMGEHEGMGCKQALDAISDVTARQRCTGNALDVAAQLERCVLRFATELRTP